MNKAKLLGSVDESLSKKLENISKGLKDVSLEVSTVRQLIESEKHRGEQ